MFFMKRQLRLNVVFLLVLFVLSLGMLPSGKAFAADRPGKVKNVPLDHPMLLAARHLGTSFGD